MQKSSTASQTITRTRPARRLKAPVYKSFRLTKKRITHPVKIVSAWKLSRRTVDLLTGNWKMLAGIAVVYGILSLVLVRGLSSGLDVGNLKDSLSEVFGGGGGKVASGLTVFVLLVSSSGSSFGEAAAVYQSFLVLITSLVLIWAIRQLQAGSKVGVREAFYKGVYPLVPFVLVFLVVGLQLLPMWIGSELYSIVVGGGIAVYFVEKLLWGILFFLLALLSLYMITSSVFALYIVTLPDMTPLKALRSARELVRYRRWTVLRKVIFLPVALLLIAAAIMLPVILFAAPLAQWVFFALTIFGLVVTHAYMYTLYRELL